MLNAFFHLLGTVKFRLYSIEQRQISLSCDQSNFTLGVSLTAGFKSLMVMGYISHLPKLASQRRFVC